MFNIPKKSRPTGGNIKDAVKRVDERGKSGQQMLAYKTPILC